MQKEHNQAILSPSPSVGKKKSRPLLSFKQKQKLLIVHEFTTRLILINMKIKERNEKAGQNAKRT